VWTVCVLDVPTHSAFAVPGFVHSYVTVIFTILLPLQPVNSSGPPQSASLLHKADGTGGVVVVLASAEGGVVVAVSRCLVVVVFSSLSHMLFLFSSRQHSFPTRM
jgi:hypothetical protein